MEFSIEIVQEGYKVIEPENPQKINYVFIEWQLNGEKFDFDTPITSNIILVAKWDQVIIIPIYYTVSFNSDNGDVINIEKVQEGYKVTEPADPKKENYTFIEWQLDGVKFDFDAPITTNIELTAKWEAIEN